jgi:hypothetical protein
MQDGLIHGKLIMIIIIIVIITDREVMSKRPDIIIKNKKEKTCTDRCGNTSGQKCHAKGSRKDTKIQQFMYRETADVEHQMCDCTSSNWSHRNSNKRFKEKFGSHTRKTFNRFTTNDSCTWNITHNTQSTAV